MQKITQFLKEVKIELSRVAWPTRQQLINYTLAVLGISLFLALFLGALDGIFAYGLNKFINN